MIVLHCSYHGRTTLQVVKVVVVSNQEQTEDQWIFIYVIGHVIDFVSFINIFSFLVIQVSVDQKIIQDERLE